MKTFTPLLLLSAVLLSGCVSRTTVDYDRAAAAKFSSYQSFTIDSRDKRTGYQDVVLSPIVDRRIEKAISQILSARGMTQNSAKPDFIVTFNTITQARTDVNDYGTSIFSRRYPYRYGYSGFSHIDVDQYEEGTFVVDIIDNESKELVWRGASTKRLGWSAPSDEEVREIIGEILVEFPPTLEK